MQHFKNALKVNEISIVLCFLSRSDQFVHCNHLNVNFIKSTLKNHLFLKKVDFCIFNPKNFEGKENCSKTLLNVCILNCTYIGKNHFNFIRVWSEIMSLKSDLLELGFSIFLLNDFEFRRGFEEYVVLRHFLSRALADDLFGRAELFGQFCQKSL